jgi:hypothetical protein
MSKDIEGIIQRNHISSENAKNLINIINNVGISL